MLEIIVETGMMINCLRNLKPKETQNENVKLNPNWTAKFFPILIVYRNKFSA